MQGIQGQSANALAEDRIVSGTPTEHVQVADTTRSYLVLAAGGGRGRILGC